MTSYEQFIASKRLVVPAAGIDVAPERLNPHLFPFQRDLVRWGLRKGRAALFCTTGMGKTLMQLAWAEHAAERVLILAPLAVAKQTVREGERFGITVIYARSEDNAPARGIVITNYEMLGHFQPERYGAVVLDESSCLKAYDSKTCARVIETFQRMPYRLACTATPAPNDIAEIANHCAFLGAMTRQEMIAVFFVNRSARKDLQLKRHGRQAFYHWLASWGMSLTKPSDLGYSDDGYDLPPLTVEPVFVETDYQPSGRLFADRLQGVTERAEVRRQTIGARVDAVLHRMADDPSERWICWYGLLEEGRLLKQEIGEDCVFVEGSLPAEEKEQRLLDFVEGRVPVLVTHPSIGGFGLNLQHCARMAFVGLSDSFETYFQCVRRCWRFGQTREVKAYVILSEPERVIYENVLKKERQAQEMTAELVRHVAEFERSELKQVRERSTYRAEEAMVLPRFLK